jgi:hypothetical protein
VLERIGKKLLALVQKRWRPTNLVSVIRLAGLCGSISCPSLTTCILLQSSPYCNARNGLPALRKELLRRVGGTGGPSHHQNPPRLLILETADQNLKPIPCGILNAKLSYIDDLDSTVLMRDPTQPLRTSLPPQRVMDLLSARPVRLQPSSLLSRPPIPTMLQRFP